MFVLNDDMSIYVTRGDALYFALQADDDGKNYKFQPGDIVRIKVFGKKDAESVVLQKDFPVSEVTENVAIYLTKEDTKFGEVISKPKDYWYEIELNPDDDDPKTIVGYDEDGPKVFKLFPEGDDVEDYEPTPEDFPVVDSELDLTSPRPVANQAIARAYQEMLAGYKATNDAVAKLHVTPEMFGAIGDGVADDTEAIAECITYAEENALTVSFMTRTYCVSSPLTLKLNNVIYGNDATIKAIAEMDSVIIVNKTEASDSCSTVYDLNIDGNSLATKGIFVKYGKGITLKNIRVSGATNAQMQVCDTDQQVWELVVDNVELRSEYEGGYSPYGLLTYANNTDSYFKNILVINSSKSWVYSGSAACNFENIHGYGYPVELAADEGFVFKGNGNFIRGLSVDTPLNKGVVVDGDYNTFSDISVGNMQSETGRGIEVNGNTNRFDGVRCSSYYCFYITSGENTVEDFKCQRLQSKSTYDYFFTGKLPYRAVFDTKTEVKNNIKRHFIFNDQWFYQSVLNMEIAFGAELRYNNYNVRLMGVEVSAPNYSLVKTTTGCTITCTDAITSGRKVNVIIESPSIALI